jgi:hypothetical protein
MRSAPDPRVDLRELRLARLRTLRHGAALLPLTKKPATSEKPIASACRITFTRRTVSGAYHR